VVEHPKGALFTPRYYKNTLLSVFVEDFSKECEIDTGSKPYSWWFESPFNSMKDVQI
jgi:hypothetical protein